MKSSGLEAVVVLVLVGDVGDTRSMREERLRNATRAWKLSPTYNVSFAVVFE